MLEQSRLGVDEVRPSVWVVAAFGEQDLSTVSELEAALEHITEVSDTTAIVDLSETAFIDLSVVDATVRQARGHPDERADWLVVVAPSGRQPRRVLDSVEAERVLRLFETRDDALRFAEAREFRCDLIRDEEARILVAGVAAPSDSAFLVDTVIEAVGYAIASDGLSVVLALDDAADLTGLGDLDQLVTELGALCDASGVRFELQYPGTADETDSRE